MGKLDKFLLSIVLIAGMCFCISIASLFYSVPVVTDKVIYLLDNFYLANYIFAGFCIFMCLFLFALFILVLFFPSKANMLVMKRDKGSIIFSRKTVESTVLHSFSDLGQIGPYQIKLKLRKNPNKTIVYTKLSLKDTVDVIELTENVRARIGAALQHSLGITPKSIIVKIADSAPGKAVKAPAETYIPKENILSEVVPEEDAFEESVSLNTQEEDTEENEAFKEDGII